MALYSLKFSDWSESVQFEAESVSDAIDRMHYLCRSEWIELWREGEIICHEEAAAIFRQCGSECRILH